MAKTKAKPKAKKDAADATAREEQPGLRPEKLQELLLEALETEMGGVTIYETALECAQNPELREEWEKYLEQTRRHVQVVEELCRKLGIDPETETPGRDIVGGIGDALVEAMEDAQEAGDPAAAEIVAAECVSLAETKDHHNWGLIGEAAKAADGDVKRALVKAYGEVEDEEDEHLYHSQGWARELSLSALGVPAALPPPEEKHDVKSMEAAAKAKKGRAKDARETQAKAAES